METAMEGDGERFFKGGGGGRMARVRFTRTMTVPDPSRAALYARAPDLGPGVLFFSGGSALGPICPELIRHTHNSVHIITPFDSGGSSARLREAFDMPAIGDVRNRLLALADRSVQGHPDVYRLFAHRFAKDGDPAELAATLADMVRGTHPLMAAVRDPLRAIARHHLKLFERWMPADFDLQKASIGNLILTGGYLNCDRNMAPVIYLFSKLVRARGVVRPLIDRRLHLVAELADGRRLVGQHLITGKERPPITADVSRIYLSERMDDPAPVDPPLSDEVLRLIRRADLICYPMGSFFSSILANLLPSDVGAAARANPCPKVFVPNTLPDPELRGLSLTDQVARLMACLMPRSEPAPAVHPAMHPAMHPAVHSAMHPAVHSAVHSAGHPARHPDGPDGPDGPADHSALDFVLVDLENGRYPGGVDPAALARLGVTVIDAPLAAGPDDPSIQGALLVPALLSLV